MTETQTGPDPHDEPNESDSGADPTLGGTEEPAFSQLDADGDEDPDDE